MLKSLKLRASSMRARRAKPPPAPSDSDLLRMACATKRANYTVILDGVSLCCMAQFVHAGEAAPEAGAGARPDDSEDSEGLDGEGLGDDADGEGVDAGDGYRDLLAGTCAAVSEAWDDARYRSTLEALRGAGAGARQGTGTGTGLQASAADAAIAEISRRLTEAHVAAVGGIFLLAVAAGPRWLLDLKHGGGSITRAEAAAGGASCKVDVDATITVTSQVLARWLDGRLDPLTAVLTGQMEVTGTNTPLAMRLSVLQQVIDDVRRGQSAAESQADAPTVARNRDRTSTSTRGRDRASTASVASATSVGSGDSGLDMQEAWPAQRRASVSGLKTARKSIFLDQDEEVVVGYAVSG